MFSRRNAHHPANFPLSPRRRPTRTQEHAFGKSTGESGFDAAFDLDGNGVVNNSDFAQFRSRFGVLFTY